MAEASFTGEEFLKYAFNGNTEGDSFVLHFKTKQPAGLLYHMGKFWDIVIKQKHGPFKSRNSKIIVLIFTIMNSLNNYTKMDLYFLLKTIFVFLKYFKLI